MMAAVEARERAATGIKNLRVGYNRVFGYYIEVTKAYQHLVPYGYIRKQTLANSERYVTEELKELEEKITGAESNLISLEYKLFTEIRETLLGCIDRLQSDSALIAELDFYCSLAHVAFENNYCRPKILTSGKIEITDGRHPVVEKNVKEGFVPNNTMMNARDDRLIILTGPNMAGKSTYMRQVALIVLMAHLGCFVPAKEAKIPLTDRIFTRVGASDNLIFDQSTFMVEMTEVASILLHATKDSLLILDEVGRGTSTYDGLSIAWSVIEFLTEKIRAKTLFATHYHELTELENKIEGVKNYKITVREMNGAVVFLRKIARGGANRSFGIEVASLAGVPKEITVRAKGILKTLEKNDIAKGRILSGAENETEEEKRTLSEAEKILSETDLDTLSPMQALLLLSDLKEKVKAEN